MTGTLFVLLATFFWALDTLIRYPLLEAGFSPLQIVFAEHVFLVVAMSAWLLVRKQSPWAFVKGDWLALLVIGGGGSAIATLAFTQAFSYMNPTLVILLQKLQPIVAISLSAIILKERLNAGFLLCAVVAFAGGFFLLLDDLILFIGAEGWHYRQELSLRAMGYGLALIAVLGWGASTVFGKKLALSGYSSAQIMNGRFTVGLIVLLPFFMVSVPFEQSMNSVAISKIALLVLLSGIVGMVLYYQGLSRIQSKHSAIAEMSFPIMAGVINWVVLDLALTSNQIIGAVLLVVASFAVHYRFEVAREMDPQPSN